MRGNFYSVLLLLGGILHLVASSSTNSLYNCTLVVNSSNPSAREDCRCPPEGATVVCANLTSALLAVGNSTRVIVQEPQNHTLFPLPEFRWLHDVFLLGANGSVRVTCEQNVSLSFIHSQRISVEGLKFYGCGALHYSTSRNFKVTNIYTKLEFLSFKASVYFESCEDIAFSNVTIANSDGIGLAMYGTIGENNFENCEFSDNSVEGNEWGGGGVFIEFPYCFPGKPQSCDIESFNYTDARYRFSLCNFTDNIAYADHPVEYAYFYPQDEYHLSFGRGGGLSVFLMSARNITLKLDDCRFVNNTAAWGGGLFLEFQGQSTNNMIEICNTIFKHNHATDFTELLHEFSDSKLLVQKTGGGGARVGFAFPPNRSKLPSNNQVHFFETVFHNNSAYWGGGVSFGTIRETGLKKSSNKLSFEQCHWVKNYGRVGAAVELSLMYQATSGPSVDGVFINCMFESNRQLSYRSNVKNRYIGGGTMTSNTITFSLMGNNTFVGNHRTGIIIVDASVLFMPDSYSNFTDNTGETGGAISLWGHAFMKLHQNTHLYFVDNTAYRYGGAIAATAQSRHMNFRFLNCFIQYEKIEVEPWNWDTYLHFKGNTGGNGNESRPDTISAVSLEACFWHGWGPTNRTEDEFKMMAFCWNTSRWVYDSEDQQLDCRDRNRSYLISSFAAKYNNSHQPYQLSVVPGEPTAMKIGVSDDHFNKATEWTVYNVWSDTPKNATIASESMFTTNGKITLYGELKSTAKVYVETGEPRAVLTYINVSVRSCPPGFKVKKIVNGLHKCRCKSKGSFRGKVLCDGKNSYQSRIRLGWWIGEYTVNSSTDYVVAQSPFMHLSNRNPSILLIEDDLNQQLCLSRHRNGTLCSDCTTGYGFAAYARYWPCVKCTANQVKYTWLLYIIVQFLPIGIFFLILWLLKFKATSGAANGFIFYAQVITTAFTISVDRTLPMNTITHSSSVTIVLRQVYLTVYDVWNLNFLRDVWPPFCLSPSLNVIDLFVLEYLAAFFPFLLISILLCINRLKPLSFSPLSAVATFLVLSFSKLTIISTRIVHPSDIFNKTGDHVATVPYYYGAWDYFHDRHAVYVVLAVLIFLLFLFTPTVILMLYPFAGRFRCSRCLINWIGNVSRQKIPLFLEEYYGCYKTNVHMRVVVAHAQSFEDSSTSTYGSLEQPPNLVVTSHDYRCTAGLYFLLRIILFVTYMASETWMQILVIQQIVVTIAILYFSIFRPYIKDLYNNLDALTFAILGTINIISIFNYLTAARGQPLSSWLFAIQYCLVFLPLAWMIVGILYFNREEIGEKFQSVREKLVRLPCWRKKDEQDDVLLPRSVPSTSIHFSSAECAQDNDLTESVRFSRGGSRSASELEQCHLRSKQLVQRSKCCLNTGRPSSSQLQSMRE